MKYFVFLCLLLSACGAQDIKPIQSSSDPQVEINTIGYSSPKEAYQSLVKTPNAKVTNQSGWKLVSLAYDDTNESWTFIPDRSSTELIVLKRVMQHSGNNLDIETFMYCKALQSECDGWLNDFKEIDEKLKRDHVEQFERKQKNVYLHRKLSKECENNNINACFKAADFVWNLRLSDLEACLPNQLLCIKKGEARDQARQRLGLLSVNQYEQVCTIKKQAEACLRAGSSLASSGNNLSDQEYEKVSDKAEYYFGLACNYGSQQGCRFKGTTRPAR